MYLVQRFSKARMLLLIVEELLILLFQPAISRAYNFSGKIAHSHVVIWTLV